MSNRRKILAFFAVAIFIVSPQLTQARSAAQQLEQTLRSIRTMQANFSQVVYTKGRILQRSKGSMAIRRPGRMRWYSEQPSRQLIVADGKNLWIYNLGLRQVNVRPQNKGLRGTPALFLSGFDKKLTNYFAIKLRFSKGALRTYVLFPTKGGSSFSSLQVTFQGNHLLSMQSLDKLGQRSLMRFTHVRVNKSLPSHLFRLKIPKGVDVIRR